MSERTAFTEKNRAEKEGKEHSKRNKVRGPKGGRKARGRK